MNYHRNLNIYRISIVFSFLQLNTDVIDQDSPVVIQNLTTKKKRPKTCIQAIAQKNIIKVFKFHEIFLAGGKTFSLFTDPQHSPFSLNTQSSFWNGLSSIQYWRKLDNDVTYWWAWSLILLREGFNKFFFTTVSFIFSSLRLTKRPRVGYNNHFWKGHPNIKQYILNKEAKKIDMQKSNEYNK